MNIVDRCGWQINGERFLWDDNPAPSSNLTKIRKLGRGRTGEVDEVRAQNRAESMVRKAFYISRSKREAARDVRRVKEEIATLRAIRDPHIFAIGCYQEDPGGRHHTVYALMYPVGDGDLTSFLELDRKGLPPSQVEKHSQWIKKWFFCLSSALAYLHSQRMIHEDIKPSNIIHRGEQIYFTDFGSCRRISPGDDTSTESPALVTRLFAAPEALISDNGEFSRHGSKSDVFSLGLVFIEMLTILTGRTVDQLRVSISDPNQAQLQYHQYIHRFEYWFKLYKYHPIDRPQSWAIILYDECLHFMVRADRKTRPTARQVVRMLESYSGFRESISCECHRSEAYLEEYMGMDDDEGKSNKDHGGQERSTEEDMYWEIEYDYLEAMAF